MSRSVFEEIGNFLKNSRNERDPLNKNRKTDIYPAPFFPKTITERKNINVRSAKKLMALIPFKAISKGIPIFSSSPIMKKNPKWYFIGCPENKGNSGGKFEPKEKDLIIGIVREKSLQIFLEI